MRIVEVISSSSYLIPVLLFFGAFFIYSYNLEGQPWHPDEINYLGWAGNYVYLVNHGFFGNSCLLSIDDCNMLYHIPAHGATYSPIRMLLIGIPMSWKNVDGGDFFNWSCYWFSCYHPDKAPTISQMDAGRTLSPLFGALTVMISFLVGKILFNKYAGIIVTLLFLFYDLWLWYSRTIMVEVHYVFFSMLTLLVLLYAVKSEQIKIKYLALAAITYGFALTSKLISVEFSVLFAAIILFVNLTKGKDVKGQVIKSGLAMALFFAISGAAFLLTEPGFYKDPIGQIILTKTDMDNYNRDVWFIGYPNIQGLQPVRILALTQYTIFPSLVDYHASEPAMKVEANYSWNNPPTYSTIPMSLFFFIGFGYIVNRIRKLKDCLPEVIMVVWFASTFIYSLLIPRDFSLERYLLPLLISIIFISAYGFWNFVRGIPYYKTKILFGTSLVIAHTVTALFYWQKIYYSYGTFWFNPLRFGTFQQSIENMFPLVINLIFLAFFGLMISIRFRQKVKNVRITQ